MALFGKIGKFFEGYETSLIYGEALLIWYSFDEQISRNMREFLVENTQKLYHVSNSIKNNTMPAKKQDYEHVNYLNSRFRTSLLHFDP